LSQKYEMNTDYLPAWILVITIGTYMIYRFKDEIYMLFNYVERDGVIENWAQAKVKGESQFHPLIAYEDVQGRVKFRADEFCKDEPMYPVGTKVKVRMHPRKKAMRKVVYPKKN
jgi:hypothetical protein